MTHDPSPREPLTVEEQALARRLAQLGQQAEPSPALDARVLAAARAASSVSPASARPGVRWPVVFGLAASMVLAVGIAWRLRPLPEPLVVAAPVAKPPPALAVRVIPPREVAGEAARAPLPPPPPMPAVEPRSVAPHIAAAPAPQEAPAAEPPAPQEAATTLDKIEMSGSRTSAAPAPVALPAAPPPAMAEPEMQAGSNAARKAAAEQAPEETGVDAAAAADQAASDEPEAEVPPATADSPEVRDAWLQRIRELAASGQTDAARASLKEFIRRHPDAPLPDDLRALSR